LISPFHRLWPKAAECRLVPSPPCFDCSTARREPHAEQDMEPYVGRAGKCFEPAGCPKEREPLTPDAQELDSRGLDGAGPVCGLEIGPTSSGGMSRSLWEIYRQPRCANEVVFPGTEMRRGDRRRNISKLSPPLSITSLLRLFEFPPPIVRLSINAAKKIHRFA
jgi:hypothetical protein